MRRALIVLLALAPAPARAAQVLLVMSEPLKPSTEEALEGLRAGWEIAIDTASADAPLPAGPHGVIIAFGGRAADRARTADGPLVIALAPAYRGGRRRGPAAVRVAMTPAPERFIDFLAAAGVRRLLAVRAAPADADFLRRAVAAGKPVGVVIDDRILPAPQYLPDLLRGPGRAADALWLAPDPGMVNSETFGIAREFSRARAVPFFAPAAGLVADEVRGELTVSFRDCGREAARAARELLAGRPVERIVYPSSLKVDLSTSAASAR